MSTNTRILDRSNEADIADYIIDLDPAESDDYGLLAGLVRAILLVVENLRPSERELAIEECQSLLAEGLDYSPRG